MGQTEVTRPLNQGGIGDGATLLGYARTAVFFVCSGVLAAAFACMVLMVSFLVVLLSVGTLPEFTDAQIMMVTIPSFALTSTAAFIVGGLVGVKYYLATRNPKVKVDEYGDPFSLADN